MNLQERIDLLTRLGEYMLSDSETWTAGKERASRENSWFIPEFIDLVRQKYSNDIFYKKKPLKNGPQVISRHSKTIIAKKGWNRHGR